MAERFYSNPGKREKIIYRPHIDKNGVIHLRQDQIFDLYADIQSHKDSVDLNVLYARYKSGEQNALNRVQAFYADVTNAPKTYAECLNLIIEANNMFASLPVDDRRKYDFDVNKYIASLGVIMPKVEPTSAPIGGEVNSNNKEGDTK